MDLILFIIYLIPSFIYWKLYQCQIHIDYYQKYLGRLTLTFGLIFYFWFHLQFINCLSFTLYNHWEKYSSHFNHYLKRIYDYFEIYFFNSNTTCCVRKYHFYHYQNCLSSAIHILFKFLLFYPCKFLYFFNF